VTKQKGTNARHSDYHHHHHKQQQQQEQKLIKVNRSTVLLLLIAPSISELQRLFNCERELEWLDMRINVRKIQLLTNWS